MVRITSSLLSFIFGFVLSLTIVNADDPVYVYRGNPYIPGPFIVDHFYLEKTDGIPLHTSVYFPRQAGKYVVNFYIGGLGGIVWAESYAEVLRGVASHGIIVIGVDAWWPLLEEQEESEAKYDIITQYFAVLSWLESNLNDRLNSVQKGVVASFDHVVISGHSAGVDAGLLMLARNCSWAKAAVMLEGGFSEKINFTLPILAYGTELATQPRRCGIDINHFYNSLTCPRAAVNVTTYGHCDLLDPFFWEACKLTGFCKTVDGTNLPLYRVFAQGIITAWIVGVVQENCDTLKYVLNQDLIPLPLSQLSYDFGCLTDRKCPKPGCYYR